MKKQTEAQRLAKNLQSDGEGCICFAYSAGECACDANWAEYYTDHAASLLLQQEALLRLAMDALWTSATPKAEAVITAIRDHLEES